MSWLVYLTIPLIAATIGYATKRVAIEMMFRPLTFVGVRPLFGWQGVVPRHAERMATIAAELLTTKLIDPREVFATIDADRLRAEIEQPLLTAIDHIARDVLAEHHPGAWESLPPLAQEVAVKQLQAAAPRIVRQVVHDLRANVDSVVDLKQLAVQRLIADRAKLVRLIRELAQPELAFIARSGIWFGFGIGLAQAVVWGLTKQPLVMPLFGAAIGFFTDWLAIRLVFQPREPRRLLGGRITMHGSFHRRRREVARQYGQLIATEVLTAQSLVGALLSGPGSARVRELVAMTVDDVVDEQIRMFRPLVSATIGSSRIEEMKRAAAGRALPQLGELSRGAHGYLTEAMDVARVVEDRIRDLTPAQYEALLRPAFKQEEWKLITVGGVLGGIVGELQALLMLG